MSPASDSYSLQNANQTFELILCKLIGYGMRLRLKVEGDIYYRRKIL